MSISEDRSLIDWATRIIEAGRDEVTGVLSDTYLEITYKVHKNFLPAGTSAVRFATDRVRPLHSAGWYLYNFKDYPDHVVIIVRREATK
jgi:hypothetical protein